jgi:hypothetical protein
MNDFISKQPRNDAVLLAAFLRAKYNTVTTNFYNFIV